MISDQRISNVKTTLSRLLAIFVWAGLFAVAAPADELILDESLTNFQAVGDFDVSSCNLPVEQEAEGLLDENGEISTGKLYSYFQSKGMDSVNEIVFCVDVDPSGARVDYSLEDIVLSIEDFGRYTLGENSLMLPAYEASTMKPEAQLAIKLGYDFMQRFDANSTERIKLDFALAGGEERSKTGFTIGVLPETRSSFPVSRFLFLTAFACFWFVVFVVLFRATNPRGTADIASAA